MRSFSSSTFMTNNIFKYSFLAFFTRLIHWVLILIVFDLMSQMLIKKTGKEGECLPRLILFLCCSNRLDSHGSLGFRWSIYRFLDGYFSCCTAISPTYWSPLRIICLIIEWTWCVWGSIKNISLTRGRTLGSAEFSITKLLSMFLYLTSNWVLSGSYIELQFELLIQKPVI